VCAHKLTNQARHTRHIYVAVIYVADAVGRTARLAARYDALS